MRGLVHGPRSEQDHPMQIGRRQDVGACSIGDSALDHGSRSMGLGKMVQEPWARFDVSKWGVFCH
jgi:hypothetical protein